MFVDIFGVEPTKELQYPSPMKNKSKLTRRAIDLKTHELLIQPYQKGESQFTIAFLQYLQSQYPQSRIALIWDGASYHRSGEVKSYLDSVNQGLEPKNWKITCIRFARQRVAGVPPVVATAEVAPNAPEQNPIEDVWLSAKRFLREFYSLCSTFAIALRARRRHR